VSELEVDLPKLIEVQATLMQDFMENGREVLDYVADPDYDILMPYLVRKFKLYDSLKGSEKLECLRTMTVASLFGPLGLIMQQDEKMRSMSQYYRGHFAPRVQMGLPASGMIGRYGPTANRRQVFALIEEIMGAEFPERALQSKKPQAVGIGMRGSRVPFEGSYLFPDKADPRDTLFVQIEVPGLNLNGGFGRRDLGFFTGFGFPCWGSYDHPYAAELQAQTVELTVRMFCKMLKFVYPYHVRLWDGYFGKDER
jgi:hypothetical protein